MKITVLYVSVTGNTEFNKTKIYGFFLIKIHQPYFHVVRLFDTISDISCHLTVAQ